MQKSSEIKVEDLRLNVDFTLDSSDAIPYLIDSEVYDRINEILDYDTSGHIYISAKDNHDIQNVLLKLLGERYKNSDTLYWGYIYNFHEPNKPCLLKFTEKEKSDLQDDLQLLMENIKNEMIGLTSKGSYNDKVVKIKSKFEDICDQKIDDLKQLAKELGFTTKVTEEEIYFTPILENKKMNRDDYYNLTLEDQEDIKNRLLIVESKANILKESMCSLRDEELEEINGIKIDRVITAMSRFHEETIDGRNYSLEITDYIKNIECDVLENIEYCFRLQNITSAIKINDSVVIDEVLNCHKYKVNILNDGQWNEKLTYKFNLDYYELFGKIAYETKDNDYVTNHTLIEGGLLTKNISKFVVINLKDILNSSLVYEKFKKSLLNKEVSFENLREKYGVLPLKSIEPEPVPFDIPVILVGEHSLYQRLCEYDNEFLNLFNYHIKIDDTIELNKKNTSNFLCYLEERGIEKNLAKNLLEWSVKESGSRKKISVNLKKLNKLIELSRNIAFNHKNRLNKQFIDEGEKIIGKSHHHYYKKVNQLLKDEMILLDVENVVVGQVNGLAVTELEACKVAMPIRITCTLGQGESRIISIEDKSKISGKIFNKGINIIRGYLNELVFNNLDSGYECYVCFEQLYGMLEGDSAMLGIVGAIISAFSCCPVNQSLAVTGSMDQKGNVQPIGAVSEKIEGFYDACKVLGKNNMQGVIVPRRNYNDIILKEEICKDIEAGSFHIYLVDRVEEVIERLLGCKIDLIIEKIYDYSK